jgi:hypothetical protein
MSLKLALEALLGGPCYHMLEVFAHPEHVPMWHAAMRDEPVDWDALFDGYVAAVDFPAAAAWRDIAAAYPDAPVLLSTRRSADEWWRSASNTILSVRPTEPEMADWLAMTDDMFARISTDPSDEALTKAGYDAHNAAVRAEVPPERLIDWQPADGWGPICAGLGLPVPDEPFPHTNTTEEFQARLGDALA